MAPSFYASLCKALRICADQSRACYTYPIKERQAGVILSFWEASSSSAQVYSTGASAHVCEALPLQKKLRTEPDARKTAFPIHAVQVSCTSQLTCLGCFYKFGVLFVGVFTTNIWPLIVGNPHLSCHGCFVPA